MRTFGNMGNRVQIWQVGLLLLLTLAVAFTAALAGYFWLYDGADDDEAAEGELLVTVRRGDLVDEVSVSGRLAYANRETLSFAVGGVIGEILVEEGGYVGAGRLLARLDAESVAALERDVAKARVAVRDALDALAAAGTPHSALDFAKAESDAAAARIAHREAQAALDALGVVSDYDLAKAQAKVAAQRFAQDTAKDALADTIAGADTDDIAESHSIIRITTTDLDNAERDLELARREWDARLGDARDAVAVAIDALGDRYEKWFGARPPDERITQGLDAALKSWGTDLDSIFDPESAPVPEGAAWDAGTVSQWLKLPPGEFSARCDGPPADGALCAQADFEQGWENYTDRLADLDTLELRAARDLAAAEETVTTASEKLFNAQYALADVLAAPNAIEVEHKRKELDLAKVAVAVAEQELEDLLAEPEVLALQAAILELAVKQATLDEANERLAAMRQAADPLDVALLQSDAAAAQVALSAALADLEAATLRAPWEGVVTALAAKEGQQVEAGETVARMAAPGVVLVSGVAGESDVLHLREGVAVSVTLDALRGRTLAGVVASVGGEPIAGEGAVGYPFQVAIETPPDVQLPEGLSAEVGVVIGEERGALLIPVSALYGASERPAVRVRAESGEVELRQVTLGSDDGYWVVVESGLREGETLLAEPDDAAPPR